MKICDYLWELLTTFLVHSFIVLNPKIELVEDFLPPFVPIFNRISKKKIFANNVWSVPSILPTTLDNNSPCRSRLVTYSSPFIPVGRFGFSVSDSYCDKVTFQFVMFFMVGLTSVFLSSYPLNKIAFWTQLLGMLSTYPLWCNIYISVTFYLKNF